MAAGSVAITVNLKKKINEKNKTVWDCMVLHVLGRGDEGFAPFVAGTCIILAGNLSLAVRASEVLSGGGVRVCEGGRGRLNGAMQKV